MSTFSTPFRSLQALGANSARALGLKVLASEFITAYPTACVFADKVTRKSVTNGITGQFPLLGRYSGGAWHTPGVSLDPAAGPQVTERLIHVDRRRIYPIVLPEFDRNVAHYEYRAPLVDQMVQCVSRDRDERISRVIARAARTASGNPTGIPYGISGARTTGGAAFRGAALATTVANLRTAIWAAAQRLDENNVARGVDNRTIALRPAQYYLMLNETSTTGAMQLNRDVGGSGNVSTGEIRTYAGFNFVMTNNMANANVTTEDVAATTGTVSLGGGPGALYGNGGNNYNGDFRNTIALCFAKDCVGNAVIDGFKMESEYSVRTQADLLAMSFIEGLNVLRTEGAIELWGSDTPLGDVDATNNLLPVG